MSRKTQNFREVQDDYKEKVVGLCCQCQKPVNGGWYGARGEAGSCSKTCETLQAQAPLYPGHDEESFLKKFNL